MATPQRFLYHSNAAVISGHLHRPADVWVDVGASALPTEGGVSNTTMPGRDFGGVIGFDAARTRARGSTRQVLPARAKTGRTRPPTPPSEAHVEVEIDGLYIGGPIRMTASRICAQLTARCACAAEQPSIAVLDGACCEGIAFGGHRLSVAIDRAFFRSHDTQKKMAAACSGRHGATARKRLLAPPASGSAGAAGSSGSLTTIVKSLRWTGQPYPGATLDRHVVTIPGFGRASSARCSSPAQPAG
jgi:hypothetical protein